MLGKNFVPFIALAFLLLLPQLIFQWWWGSDALISEARSGSVRSVSWLVFKHQGAGFVVSGIINCVLLSALVFGTIETLAGKPYRILESISAGFKYLPKILMIGLTEALLLAIGLIFLIVPGIIVAVMLCVSVPVCVVENKSVLDSLSRSAALTSGERWEIFGLMVAFGIFNFTMVLAIHPLSHLSVFAILPEGVHITGLTLYLMANTALLTLMKAVQAVGFASVYYELRTIKEGITPEQVASAFA